MTQAVAGPGAAARFSAAAADFSRRRAVVLGDVMLDRYVEGPADRVSPEAPVPVVRVDKEWDAVGGAGNVAANIRALGAQCDLVAVVGDDRAGRAIDRILGGIDVGCRFAAVAERPTTVKTRVIAQGQQVVRVDREDDAVHSPATEALVRDLVRKRLADADVLVLADYDKGVLAADVLRDVLAAAAAADVPSVVDPKRRNFFGFAGATVFKPNRSEMENALGEPVRPGDAPWMESVRQRLGCTHLLLTLGADGMALASPGGALNRVRVRPRSVYDVSGAGDTVSAVVAVALASGADLGEAVLWAAHAAAVGLATAGVSTVSPAEIGASIAGVGGVADAEEAAGNPVRRPRTRP